MQVNIQNTITCRLTKREAAEFAAWGTREDISCVNQAMKRAIAIAIQASNKQAEAVVVD